MKIIIALPIVILFLSGCIRDKGDQRLILLLDNQSNKSVIINAYSSDKLLWSNYLYKRHTNQGPTKFIQELVNIGNGEIIKIECMELNSTQKIIGSWKWVSEIKYYELMLQMSG